MTSPTGGPVNDGEPGADGDPAAIFIEAAATAVVSEGLAPAVEDVMGVIGCSTCSTPGITLGSMPGRSGGMTVGKRPGVAPGGMGAVEATVGDEDMRGGVAPARAVMAGAEADTIGVDTVSVDGVGRIGVITAWGSRCRRLGIRGMPGMRGVGRGRRPVQESIERRERGDY